MKRSALCSIRIFCTLCIAAQQPTPNPSALPRKDSQQQTHPAPNGTLPQGATAPTGAGATNAEPQPISVPQDRLPAVLQAEYAVVVAVKDRDNLILQLRLMLHVPNDYTWDVSGLRFIPPAAADQAKPEAPKRDVERPK